MKSRIGAFAVSATIVAFATYFVEILFDSAMSPRFIGRLMDCPVMTTLFSTVSWGCVMLRKTMFVGAAVLGLVVLVNSGTSQEKKPKTPLPAGFKSLNLTAAQEDKVREVTAQYKMRIDELTLKLKELQSERLRAQMAVLSEEQRQLYIKNKTGETAAKKKEDKKKE